MNKKQNLNCLLNNLLLETVLEQINFKEYYVEFEM